jgi:hypothetical protein
MSTAIDRHTAVSSLTPLQARAAEYIARHGIRAFMDEDYNLTGTRIRAVVTEENLPLARAFGLPVENCDLPIAIEKKTILAAIDGQRMRENRLQLARFFANPANVPELSFGQRMFLEWHYHAPDNYSFTLEKPLREQPDAARILGWNRETQLTGPGDFLFYTGLLGCTGICAVAADGAAYMSHWDEVCNPKQVEGYARFADKHPGGQVYIIGVTSRNLADRLCADHPKLTISYHVKKIYYERTYTVCFARTRGRVEITVQEADVTDDYVSSVHNGQYGRWFPYGRFSQAFPGTDDEFLQCTFETLR